MPVPMLADFALRLSCGLAFLLLLTPWRLVPPAFFRTHCLVILGLLVVAVLDAWRLGVRGAVGLALWVSWATAPHASTVSPLFLAVRWGMGVLGPAVATLLTWKTVAIRSTQSATGILYIAMTLVLFGELTAMVMSRETG